MIRETRCPIIAGGRDGAVVSADCAGRTADAHQTAYFVAAHPIPGTIHRAPHFADPVDAAVAFPHQVNSVRVVGLCQHRFGYLA